MDLFSIKTTSNFCVPFSFLHANRPPGAGFLLPGQRGFPLAAAAPRDARLLTSRWEAVGLSGLCAATQGKDW